MRAEQPERRYTYGGRYAHLLVFGTDYNTYPYARALCGISPRWGVAWMGSGSWRETEYAKALPTCRQCLKVLEKREEE